MRSCGEPNCGSATNTQVATAACTRRAYDRPRHPARGGGGDRSEEIRKALEDGDRRGYHEDVRRQSVDWLRWQAEEIADLRRNVATLERMRDEQIAGRVAERAQQAEEIEGLRRGEREASEVVRLIYNDPHVEDYGLLADFPDGLVERMRCIVEDRIHDIAHVEDKLTRLTAERDALRAEVERLRERVLELDDFKTRWIAWKMNAEAAAKSCTMLTAERDALKAEVELLERERK